MRVTTKEVLQWNPETENYDSVLLESHNYEGEVANCEKYDMNWWFGPNSLWGQATGGGSASTGGTPVNVEIQFPTGGAPQEEDMLKYGFIALGVYVIIKLVGK